MIPYNPTKFNPPIAIFKAFEDAFITKSFTEILSKLKIKNIDKIIMVGKISRPSIQDIKLDSVISDDDGIMTSNIKITLLKN